MTEYAVKTRKKLIEVALPLDAINEASAREKSIRHGHPSTLHLWWARRPLAAARAVIFAQMVDDPSACPDLFKGEKAQEKERKRLFKIIEDLVQWENTTNEEVLMKAREEIWQSWRRTCADNADHPRAKELFDRHKLPAFHDPFAGGGALPLEAQRLGLEAYASDLNPVAVLINKAMIEIPPKFAGRPPVNPESRKGQLGTRSWRGVQGLAEDVRYYGQWMRDAAEKRVGHLYPRLEVSAAMAKERPDLKPFVGQKVTVIAWLWARTVKSPNPAFSDVEVPLVSTYLLSTKSGKEAYVSPVIEGRAYGFTVRLGKPPEAAKHGTKLSRGANFGCVMSGAPITAEYVRSEARAGRMRARLMAMVVESDSGRTYVAPNSTMESVAAAAAPHWKPDLKVPTPCHDVDRLPMYGMPTWGDVFTARQLSTLGTLADLVQDARARALRDAASTGLADSSSLHSGGVGSVAYADAVATYLAFAVDKALDRNTTLCTWEHRMDRMGNTFKRQALPMTWDYVETNPFAGAGGDVFGTVQSLCEVLDKLSGSVISQGHALQADASMQTLCADKLVSTDPPYYDNISYADLSDFFYVWLQRTLRPVFPDLLATLAVPRAEELVATPYRHGSKQEAEAFFLNGMTRAMQRLAAHTHAGFPVTIYYAFKQSETETEAGTASTGWETFLDAVCRAGFGISGTWPVRTELAKKITMGSNILASSIVLVCRKCDADARTATRRELVAALKDELPTALRRLQQGNIAPVDLAQAAIGPGMAVYTRYAKVLDAEGKSLSVREALSLINQTLDEALAEQEGDFDADSRWALAWFEQNGFDEGEYGVAETLSKAKNTSVAGLAEAGILESKRGKVRLLRPEQLSADWNPASDRRLTAWETVHQLVRALDPHHGGGEAAAAALVAKLGAKAEIARELAYRLYTLSERKKRPADALAYNGLVQSWPEIARLASAPGMTREREQRLPGME